ncbi:Uncharacterised protein [Enterobacter cloacae]|nr:hypothetical protein [Enterobacter hormaechei]EKK9105951.1 hypothetical protein [Salmonella enterica]VAK79344.1 Uncharacterised protein [Enterobacter cloacae]
MPKLQEVIPPYEQMYLLNQKLIQDAEQFTAPLIAVGGQAVQYWVSYYYHRYPVLPDARLITSVDCDYSARTDDIIAIARTLNVKSFLNKSGQPPSLAQFQLLDKDTHQIMQSDNRLFADPDHPDIANVVDIIDCPGGFETKELFGKKLHLLTTPFYVEATEPGMPEMHEKIRVLNPIACMRSRFNNLIKLRRSPTIEVARINALKIPCYFFLLEQFDEQPYRIARDIFMTLYELAWDEDNLRHQVFWDTWQGPLGAAEQSKNISLPDILERVHSFLEARFDDFEDLPEAFVTKELPVKLTRLRERFNRYVVMNRAGAARGRRGWEINRV